MRKQVYKNPDGSLVTLLTRKVKCPMCGRKHKWPTEDKLCRKCEGEYVAMVMEVDGTCKLPEKLSGGTP